MYSRAVPMPGDEKESNDTAPVFDATKDACDPSNFTNDNFDEEEIIKAK